MSRASQNIDGISGGGSEGQVGKVEAGGLHGYAPYHGNAYAVHAHAGFRGGIAAVAVGIAYGGPADEAVGLGGIAQAVAQTFSFAQVAYADERDGYAHHWQEAFAVAFARGAVLGIVAVDGEPRAADVAAAFRVAHKSGRVAQGAVQAGEEAPHGLGRFGEEVGLANGVIVMLRLVGHGEVGYQKSRAEPAAGRDEGGGLFDLFGLETEASHSGIRLYGDGEDAVVMA